MVGPGVGGLSNLKGHRDGGPPRVGIGSGYWYRFRHARKPARPVPNRRSEAGSETGSPVIRTESIPMASPQSVLTNPNVSEFIPCKFGRTLYVKS